MDYKTPESVLVVVHTDERVLLLQRADNPCFWQSVTGSLEVNETPEMTAKRELCEETSIIHAQLTDAQLQHCYAIHPSWRHRYHPSVRENKEHVFFAKLDAVTKIVLSPKEHLAYQWLSPEEAVEQCFSETNKDAIRRVFSLSIGK